jgi:hypothetical protein
MPFFFVVAFYSSAYFFSFILIFPHTGENSAGVVEDPTGTIPAAEHMGQQARKIGSGRGCGDRSRRKRPVGVREADAIPYCQLDSQA